jgi:cysteine peptidase C11 family protein
VEPEPYEIRSKGARYAVLLVMGGDDEEMDPQLYSDFWEMTKGVSEDVALLALVDYRGDDCSRVMEMTSAAVNPIVQLPEICTGDPRPVADFLARGLVSFGPETRFAIGFWGHGHGVFGDDDCEEIVVERGLRFGPLGGAFWVPDGDRSMLPDETSGNALTNREAGSAMAVAFARAGRTEPVDLLFFDTCLNGSVEVFTELERFAEVFVASSLLIDKAGWDYDLWLRITGEKKPETAEEWALLAVKVYEVVYGQAEEPAHLVATRCGLGFVEAFGDLVRGLVSRGSLGTALVSEAAGRARHVFFEENRDLRDLVRWIGELTEDAEIKGLVDRFLEVHSEAVVCATGAEEPLSGMTVWCPVGGDLKRVGSYYRGLEFERVTGWGELGGSGV